MLEKSPHEDEPTYEEYFEEYADLLMPPLVESEKVDSQTYFEGLAGKSLVDMQWNDQWPTLPWSFNDLLNLPHIHVIDSAWPNAEAQTSDGKKVYFIVHRDKEFFTIVLKPIKNFCYSNIYFYLSALRNDDTVPHLPLTTDELLGHSDVSFFPRLYNNIRVRILKTLDEREWVVQDNYEFPHHDDKGLVIVPGEDYGVGWEMQMKSSIKIGNFQLKITKPTQSS